MDGFGKVGRFEIAGIDSFADDDARIRAKFPIQLAGTDVEGSGSIGGQTSFHFGIMPGKKNKIVGSFSYIDPAAGLNINSSKLSSLVINGNQAQFSGTDKTGKHTKITFTVNVTDNGIPGTNDTFSINVSNGYSASGHLTSGNISLHN